MTEDNSDVTDTQDTQDVVTLEILASLITSSTYVKIGKHGFKIRPRSWNEEAIIDKTCDGLRDPTKPAQRADDGDRARKRMEMIIEKGLMEPEMDNKAIKNLPSGLLILLATKIDDLSSFLPKKPSTTS